MISKSSGELTAEGKGFHLSVALQPHSEIEHEKLMAFAAGMLSSKFDTKMEGGELRLEFDFRLIDLEEMAERQHADKQQSESELPAELVHESQDASPEPKQGPPTVPPASTPPSTPPGSPKKAKSA